MEDIQWSGGNSDGFMTANGITYGSDLLIKCHNFSQLQPKNWHGLAPMGQQEPASLFNNTNQTHMEDIQWSGCNYDMV